MFRQIELKPIYSTYDDDVVKEFYNPVIREATRFDRISAYFSAKALAQYAEGLEIFARKGHRYRLIISVQISEKDFNEIKEGYRLKFSITEEMLEKLKEDISLREEMNISNLAYLISIGVVEIKFAFTKSGIFHDKCGLLWDGSGNIICFRGSNNETEAAINNNYEAFTVTCSWLNDSEGFYGKVIAKSISEFEKLWKGKHTKIKVLEVDYIVMENILRYNKNEIIVEESLLKDNCLVLDFIDRLILRINIDDSSWITQGAFYKLKLKKYIEEIQDKKILFKSELTYMDYEKISNMIEKKAGIKNVEYVMTQRLKDYIEARNLHIQTRSKVGMDIKAKDEKITEKFEIYRKIVNQNMARQLREKQMWDSFFMYVMSRSCNFSVPGSGKTSSVLGVYAFLKAKGEVDKIVMIGPKNSFGSWIDEFNECFRDKETLRVFNIHDKKYKNTSSKKEGIIFEAPSCNLILLNYECLSVYKEEVKGIISKDTLLVFDEVHKIKAVNGKNAGNALDIAEKGCNIIAMTGTPIPNSYQDIYNFLHILYNDEYKEFFNFDLPMLKNPDIDEVDEINRKLLPFFCRTTKEELQVPLANEDEIIPVGVTSQEQEIFNIITAKYRSNKLALFIRVLQLESNPRLILKSLDESDFNRVLEITENIDDMEFKDYSDEIRNIIETIDITTKMKKCIETVQKLTDDNKMVIVWCIFKDSINRIEKYLRNIGINAQSIYGEVELGDRMDIISQFKQGKFQVLITNPHTLAESVSLHSVCHDAIYFEYSYNLVHLLQSKDRIHRLGLQQGQYTQYYYLQNLYKVDGEDYSLDEEIYERLKFKEQRMIQAIENEELESGYTTEEDLDMIFRKLKL